MHKKWQLFYSKIYIFYYSIAGISMHKGYAFVQFTNPFDARNACHGEDGRTVLSQVLGKFLMELFNVKSLFVILDDEILGTFLSRRKAKLF